MKEIILSQMQLGTTLEELSKVTGQSEKRVGMVLKMLENEGYLFHRAFDSNGNIKYSYGDLFNQEDYTLNITGNELRALFISDIHAGRFNDGMPFLENIFEYADKNNIHVIFILGDVFEGPGFTSRTFCESTDEEIRYFLKNYPFKSNMISFVIYGNHDLAIAELEKIDIAKRLAVRPDIINLGYGVGKICLKNDTLWLQHNLVLAKQPVPTFNARLIYKGHSHLFGIHDNIVNVPALLNEQFPMDTISTGFLDTTFFFDEDGYIDSELIRHFAYFHDKFCLANEISHSLLFKVKKKI